MFIKVTGYIGKENVFMFDFKYFTPTKVVFGKNTESKVADLIKEFGGTRYGNCIHAHVRTELS